MKKKVVKIIVALVVFIGTLFLIDFLSLIFFNKSVLIKTVYTAEDFGIKTILSSTDFDSDNLEDFSDILEGAKKDVKNHPTYDASYFEGGYPPDNLGVCTDVIWRAFKNAGYSLKDMIDKDIEGNLKEYPAVGEVQDSNIDFRRVRNLRVFFEKYATNLTTDLNKIEEWQPGDIVIFEENKHVGIISDKRNRKGIPYLIHNGGQRNREEDVLQKQEQKYGGIVGHYRWENIQSPITWED